MALHTLPAAQSGRWHFPLLGPVLLPGPCGAAGAQLQGGAGSPHPWGQGRGTAGGWPAAPASRARAGTPCPRHTWFVLQMCVLHVEPSIAAGKRGPPKGVCPGRGGEGMWLLAKRMPRQGQERKEGEERKVVTSGWKVIIDWLAYSCFSATTPSLSTFFFLLLVCFRFFICKGKSSFFFLPRRIKKAKNTGKEEERKVTHSFPDSFTKHRAERKGERRS